MPTRAIQESLRQAFAPTSRGIAGLTDQLLGAFVGSDVDFERLGDRFVCRCTADGMIREAAVPLPQAGFRAILAQVARLCLKQEPGSVTPYRGGAFLPIKADSVTKVRVDFVNTPDRQYLSLKSLAFGQSGGVCFDARNGHDRALIVPVSKSIESA